MLFFLHDNVITHLKKEESTLSKRNCQEKIALNTEAWTSKNTK